MRRLLLSGSSAQIQADLDWLAAAGVTEVFLDLNWDPLIGAPDVEPSAATDRASALLEALKPTADLVVIKILYGHGFRRSRSAMALLTALHRPVLTGCASIPRS